MNSPPPSPKSCKGSATGPEFMIRASCVTTIPASLPRNAYIPILEAIDEGTTQLDIYAKERGEKMGLPLRQRMSYLQYELNEHASQVQLVVDEFANRINLQTAECGRKFRLWAAKHARERRKDDEHGRKLELQQIEHARNIELVVAEGLGWFKQKLDHIKQDRERVGRTIELDLENTIHPILVGPRLTEDVCEECSESGGVLRLPPGSNPSVYCNRCFLSNRLNPASGRDAGPSSSTAL